MKTLFFAFILFAPAFLCRAQSDTSARMVITDKPGRMEVAIGDSVFVFSHEDMYMYYLGRGAEKAESGDYEGAVTEMNLAWLYKQDDAQLYYNRGLCYHYLQDYEKALADLDVAISLDSAHSMAYNQRGVEKCLLGNPEQSLRDFLEAIRLDPESGLNYYNMAIAYLQMDDLMNACELLDKALTRGYEKSGSVKEQYCK